jgi:hypothetical protein
MTERGYYSLIQFIPDPGRAEGATVGLALVCPALRQVHIVVSDNNEAPTQRFGKKSFDAARLNISKAALGDRLRFELADNPTLECLVRVRSLEGNSLALSEPRPVAVRVDARATAIALYQELVYLPEEKRERAKAPDTKPLVAWLEQRGAAISKPGKITVPVTGEELKVAFPYLNGFNNFVHAQGFPKKRQATVEHAKSIGAQGRLLRRHSEGQEVQTQLIVLARFNDPQHQDLVGELFSDMGVRMVPANDTERFQQEILATAHPVQVPAE